MNYKKSTRLERLPEYLFGTLNDLKLSMRRESIDILDFGMGNPDIPTPGHIVEKLRETANDPKTHRYSRSKGIPNLRKAAARYYKRQFDVDLDWETEIIACLGSKEGLAHLMLALLDIGDTVLVPNPSFPVHIYSVGIAGGNVISIPLRAEKDFIPEISEITREIWPKPKIMIFSFPHNPTTAVVEKDFFEEIIRFAQREEIIVVHDFAYAGLSFDGYRPPSMLEIDGAKEVGVEFITMSKVYSMAGWRVGFCVGNPRIIADLYGIKGYFDYGIFTPIQVAAIQALDGTQENVAETVETYRKRRDVIIDGLNSLGWNVPKPKATMYIWAPIPERYRAMGSMEFSRRLLTEAEVLVSPGIAFGERGEGYIRISLVENEHRIRQAIRNIRKVFREWDSR